MARGDKLYQTQLNRDMAVIAGYRKRFKQMAERVGAYQALSEIEGGINKLLAAIAEAHPDAKKPVPRIHNRSKNFERTT